MKTKKQRNKLKRQLRKKDPQRKRMNHVPKNGCSHEYVEYQEGPIGMTGRWIPPRDQRGPEGTFVCLDCEKNLGPDWDL